MVASRRRHLLSDSAGLEDAISIRIEIHGSPEPQRDGAPTIYGRQWCGARGLPRSQDHLLFCTTPSQGSDLMLILEHSARSSLIAAKNPHAPSRCRMIRKLGGLAARRQRFFRPLYLSPACPGRQPTAAHSRQRQPSRRRLQGFMISVIYVEKRKRPRAEGGVLASLFTRLSGSLRFGASSWSVGSIWDKSGPPSFAHECRRRMPRRSVAKRRGGGPVSPLNELRLGKPSGTTPSVQP